MTGRGLWDVLWGHPLGERMVEAYRHCYRAGAFANALQQHLPASVLQCFLTPAVWSEYFTFALVRNPWDALVSTYSYQQHVLDDTVRAQNPEMDAILRRCDGFSDFVRAYPLIRGDMTSFITDERGNQLVDFVGRYETLPEDFAYVCGRLGIDTPLVHVNRSKHAAYRDHYTAETRALVERYFARDIARFGYRF